VSRDYSVLLPARRQQVKECAHSRLGLDIDKLARQSMIRRVRKGDVKYAHKLTNSRTVIVLDHEGGERAFLYSSASKEIICFLGPNAPEIAGWVNGQVAPTPRVAPVWFRRHGMRG
jgi:hypothetical protein